MFHVGDDRRRANVRASSFSTLAERACEATGVPAVPSTDLQMMDPTFDEWVSLPTTFGEVPTQVRMRVRPGQAPVTAQVAQAVPVVPSTLEADVAIVAQLAAMGFAEVACRRAAVATRNAGLDAALNWAIDHPQHHGRMDETEAPPLGIQPDTPWQDIPERHSCKQELETNVQIHAVVPRFASLVGDVMAKFDEVRNHDADARALAAPLSDNELVSVITYTHDFQLPNQEKRGNLYFEMNNALRASSAAARQQMMVTWGLIVHYILGGLGKLPDFAGTVLRGVPGRAAIAPQYTLNRTIKWRAFTSSSTALGAAASFGSPEDVLIFRIQVTRGKVVRLLSLFQQEDEVLLFPGMKFQVSRAAYVNADDGYTYVDMVEEAPMLIF